MRVSLFFLIAIILSGGAANFLNPNPQNEVANEVGQAEQVLPNDVNVEQYFIDEDAEIFSKTANNSRQAERQLQAAEAISQIKSPAPELIGVRDSNGQRVVVLKTSQGELISARQGDLVSGWRIKRIGNDYCELTQGSEMRLIRLYRQSN